MQAYEKNCRVFLAVQNATSSTMDTSFWTTR